MANRPNILFMIADDHRHDAIRAMGDATVETPYMDALVAEGVAFRQAHIMGGLSGAVCIPTRACMHTGASTFRASAGADMSDHASILTINANKATMGETFGRAGYHTFATGKWHNDRAGFARSFESGANIFFGGMSDHLQVPLHDFDRTGLYPDEAKYVGHGFSTELFCDAAIHFLENYPPPGSSVDEPCVDDSECGLDGSYFSEETPFHIKNKECSRYETIDLQYNSEWIQYQ